MGSPSVSDALGGGAPLCVRFGNLFNSPAFFFCHPRGGGFRAVTSLYGKSSCKGSYSFLIF